MKTNSFYTLKTNSFYTLKTCSSCYATYSEEANFCSSCGKQLKPPEMNLVCDTCGKLTYSAAELKDLKVKVCQDCGGQISKRREKNREKNNREKIRSYKPHCHHTSCRHRILVNLTGRCQLGIRHVQGVCEKYEPKEHARKTPLWYYQKKEVE